MHIKPYLSRLLAVILVVVMGLIGCSANPGALSGNYTDDTFKVLETLTNAIDIASDAPNKVEIQSLARQQINDYASRYRRQSNVSSLASFTTMQTALNSLAGYYTAYGTRPLPEKLKQRIKQEFKRVEFALQRGS
jgi:photosystem II Psb27 protein